MNNFPKRLAMSVFGVITCAVSVGIFKMAAFGLDPFQTFMNGLNYVIPIKFGTLHIIVSAILLLFAFFADKHYIGTATIISLLFFGYVVDFAYTILHNIIGEPGVALRVILLIIAVVILCFASSFYIVADLGVSVYDAISLIIANEWKLIEFKYCRIISDLISVTLGASLLFLADANFAEITALIGIGTIITAFFMGPLIDHFIRRVARPFLG